MSSRIILFLFSIILVFNNRCQKEETNIVKKESFQKPNIVLIMADDLGYGDVSCYNSESKINTRNIDKLASEGIIFTDAHSPSAVCTPTIASVLKANGYTTVIFDKCHLGMTFQNKEEQPAKIEDEKRQVDIDFTKDILDGSNHHGFDYSFVPPGCPSDDLLNFFIENNVISGSV